MGRNTIFVLVLAVILVPLQWAQSVASGPSSDTGVGTNGDAGSDEAVTTIRTSVQEVNVVFTVTDKSGHFRKGLQASDLAVYDDGKPPASVRSFRGQTDLPLRVGLVLDVSSSVTDRFSFEQDSAIRFFNQILRPETDRGFVVAFDSEPTLTQDFTDDATLLANGVKKLKPAGGSAVYDAIYLAASKKLMSAGADRPVRRVIILITDGEDNQSRKTLPEAIEAARRAEVTVYAISTNESNTVSRGDRNMRKLAEETGGRSFVPRSLKEVANAFNAIQDELRSQYALSYKPADFNADGHYRSIEIRPRSDKNLLVRARKGYFAPNR